MLKRKTISLDTKFLFPETTTEVRHNGKILIIAPECANYIVLDNEAQHKFYRLLEKHTLGETLVIGGVSEDDAKAVLVQIEAKKFTNEVIPHSNSRFQLHLFVTNGCNLRCRHCYMYSGKPEENELSFEEISNLLRCFSENEGDIVTFSGGEVTTRKDFIELLKVAHDLGLHINVMTNGTLWSEEMIRQASSFIESVQVSVDGFDEAENAKVRGVGHFEKSLQTIDSFLRNSIHTTIAVTPWFDDTLENHVDDYIHFKHAMVEKYKDFPIEVKFTGDLMNGRDLTVNSDQHELYAKIMKRVLEDGYDDMEEDIFVFNQRQKVIKDNWCTYGHLTVSAVGDVYFCGKVNLTKSLANIRNIPLQRIMDLSKKARKLSDVHHVGPCRRCELRYICGGGCRIEYFDKFTDSKKALEASESIRQCNLSDKQHYYDLMIRVNDRLFE